MITFYDNKLDYTYWDESEREEVKKSIKDFFTFDDKDRINAVIKMPCMDDFTAAEKVDTYIKAFLALEEAVGILLGGFAGVVWRPVGDSEYVGGHACGH